MLAATQIASRLMPRVPTRMLVVPGLLLAALGVALFTRLTPDASYVTHVLPTELLLGLGLGIAIVPCISTATQNADPSDVGVTSAMTNTSQQIGASIGTALLNTIAATATATYLVSHRRIGDEIARATVHGYVIGQCLGGRDLRVRCPCRRTPHQRASRSAACAGTGRRAVHSISVRRAPSPEPVRIPLSIATLRGHPPLGGLSVTFGPAGRPNMQ